MWQRQTIAVLSLVGFFVSLYLWFYKIGLIGQLQCGAGGCETVQLSPQAMFLGLPVAFYGVAGYAVLLVLSLIALQPRFQGRRGVTVALVALSTIGFLFSAYLTYLELFVIHALCRWCVVSGILMTVIWVVALRDLRRT
jgi:uncharacterized membrane protein